ncbi:MAG: M56 family metallopeptidase [Opitutales bacterium]
MIDKLYAFTWEIAPAVVDFFWQGVLISGCVTLLTSAVRLTPKTRYLVHLFAFIALALCVPFNMWLGSANVSSVGSVSNESVLIENGPDSTVSPVSLTMDSQVMSLGFGESFYLLDTTAFVWAYFIGLCFMLTRLMLSVASVRGLRAQSITMQESEWLDALDCACKALDLKMPPLIAWSKSVASPVVFGIFRPIILIPERLRSSFTVQQIESIVLHELGHLKRYDHWVVILQRVLETVFFFHPAVWWTSRQLEISREEACDDLVVESGVDATDYLSALMLCDGTDEFSSSAILAAGGSRGSDVYLRIKRILSKQKFSRGSRGALGWLAVGAFVSVFSILMVSPQLAQAEDVEVAEFKIAFQPEGAAATVNGEPIWFDDVEEFIGLIMPQIERSHSGEDLSRKVRQLQYEVTHGMVRRRVLTMEFQKSGRHIPESVFRDEERKMIDQDFGGSEGLFEEWLKTYKGGTSREQYFKEMKEEIVVSLMEDELRTKAAKDLNLELTRPQLVRNPEIRNALEEYIAELRGQYDIKILL